MEISHKRQLEIILEIQRSWEGGNNSPSLTGGYFEAISGKARDLTKPKAALEPLVQKTGELKVPQDIICLFFSKPLKNMCRVLFWRILRAFSLCMSLIVVCRITLHKEGQEECRDGAHCQWDNDSSAAGWMAALSSSQDKTCTVETCSQQ